MAYSCLLSVFISLIDRNKENVHIPYLLNWKDCFKEHSTQTTKTKLLVDIFFSLSFNMCLIEKGTQWK